MASAACNNFIQNAWRKELCTNCLKPKSQHPTGEEAKGPVPAKRVRASKSTSNASSKVANENLKAETKTKEVVDVSNKKYQKPALARKPKRDSGEHDVQGAEGEEKEKKSTGDTGDTKTVTKAEVDKEPKTESITKQEKDADKGSDISGESSAAASKKTEKTTVRPFGRTNRDRNSPPPKASVKPFMRTIECAESETENTSCDELAQTENSDIGTDAGSLSVQLEQGDTGKDASKDPTLETQTRKENSATSQIKEKSPGIVDDEQPYYHQYDITARGRSGTPQPISSADSKSNYDQDSKTPLATPYRVVDITSKAVVLPGDDIKRSSQSPPKLPSTPPPERENSGSSASSRGSSQSNLSPGCTSVSHKKDSPGDAETIASTVVTKSAAEGAPEVAQRKLSKVAHSKSRSADGSRTPPEANKDDKDAKNHPRMPVILHKEAEKLKQQSRSPTPPRKVPILIKPQMSDNDDISDGVFVGDAENTAMEPQSDVKNVEQEADKSGELTRHTQSRMSGGKSSAFEAKLAALATLDLKKPKGKVDPQPAPTKEQENSDGKNLARHASDPGGALREGMKSPLMGKKRSSTMPGKPPMTKSDSTESNDSNTSRQEREKSEKSKRGGKSFFRKLLKLGTKDCGQYDVEQAEEDCEGENFLQIEQNCAELESLHNITNEKDDENKNDITKKVRPCANEISTDQDALNVELRQAFSKSIVGGSRESDKPIERPSKEPPAVPVAKKDSDNKEKQKSEDDDINKAKKTPESDNSSPTVPKGSAVSPAGDRPVPPARQHSKLERPLKAPPPVPPMSPTAKSKDSDKIRRSESLTGKPTAAPKPTLSPRPDIGGVKKDQISPTCKSDGLPSPKDGAISPRGVHTEPSSPKLATSPRPEISCPNIDLSATTANLDDTSPEIMEILGSGSPVKSDMSSPKPAFRMSESLEASAPFGEPPKKPRPRSEFHGRGASNSTTKVVRRMRAAPPPPPDGGRRRSAASAESVGPLSSQTLPRQFKHRPVRFELSPTSSQPKYKTTDDQDVGCTTKKRMDSAAKHARNRTLSEGMKLEFDWQSVGLRKRSLPETNLNQVVDQRASKFIQRALPSPPPQEDQEIIENPYEMVSPDREKASTPYEDIEDDKLYFLPQEVKKYPTALQNSSDYLEPISNPSPPSDTAQVIGKTREPTDKLPARPGLPTKDPPTRHRVIGTAGGVLPYRPPNRHSDSSISEDELVGRLDGRPRPVPRRRATQRRPQSIGAEPYVLIYVNRDVLLERDKPALTMSDGFGKMATMNHETLQQLCDKLYGELMNTKARFRDDLKWPDFKVDIKNPVYSHSGVVFYNAHADKVDPKTCMLMISTKPIHQEMVAHTHPNVLNPKQVFHDRISSDFFPDQLDQQENIYQLYGMVQTYIFILGYNTVMSLENYVSGIGDLYKSDAEAYEKNVCYVFAQILNGMLYLNDRGYPVTGVCAKDVLVVTPSGRDEKYIIFNPYSHQENMRPEVSVSKQLIELLFLFLQVHSTPDVSDVYSAIPVKTTYSQGLQKFVQILQSSGSDVIITARNLLEFLLWGPQEEEIKMLALAENREQAFSVWLELQRCKVVNKYALEDCEVCMEELNLMRFLCASTGSTLFDTTKFLYK